MVALEKEVPYCTVCLVATALACHTMVLLGNLTTGTSFANLGHSTKGWSDVGISLGDSMSQDLDDKMTEIGSTLSLAISQITQVQQGLDSALSIIGQLSGHAIDAHQASTVAANNVSLLQMGYARPTGRCKTRVALPETGVYLTGSAAAKERRLTSLLEVHLDFLESGKFSQSPAVSTNVTDSFWDVVMHGLDQHPNRVQFRDRLHSALQAALGQTMAVVDKILLKFWDIIKPALLQVSKWLITFESKFQEIIQQFSTTLDRAQKIFDQIMAQLGGTAGLEEQMQKDTYSIFAITREGNDSSTDAGGVIALQDLKTVARLYGITTLQGIKATTLFRRYDANNDGLLQQSEYNNLVKDAEVPSIMTVALRTFSNRLAEIAGQVGASKHREDVAKAAAQYFFLVSVRNLNEVRWVAHRLINQSVPTEFSAAVLKEMAALYMDPNVLTPLDVGNLICGAMIQLNPVYFKQIFTKLREPTWWEEEGFKPDEMPPIVEQVTKWVTMSRERASKGTSLLETASSSSAPAMARLVVEHAVRAHKEKRRGERAELLQSFYTTDASKALRRELLGGVSASSAAHDAVIWQAMSWGTLARPEILEFAQYLSSNASIQSSTFLKQCFDFEKASSASLDSFASKVQAVVKKVQSFLSTMEEWSTRDAIDRTEKLITDFGKSALDEVEASVMTFYDRSMGSSATDANGTVGNATMGETLVSGLMSSPVTSKVMTTVVALMNDMLQALPAVIQNLKFARTEVSAVSNTLRQIFSVFKASGPPLLTDFGSMYKMIWVGYFVFFGLLTFGLLFYGFWASGWFGGPSAAGTEGYQGPVTFADRVRTCFSACTGCMRACHNSKMSFWSGALLCQLIVLVLFVLSIALGLIGGLRAFMGAGCSQIYLLGDVSICTGMLGSMRMFLENFLGQHNTSMDHYCEDQKLLTCQLISNNLMQSLIFTAGGSMLAAVASFQMILESAILHERAHWRLAFDIEKKD